MQPDFMYRAVADGAVDVISAYSSDGQIAQYDLVTLDDPKHVLPPYDAILLVAPKRAHDAKLIAALKPLVGAIDVKVMREAEPARRERRHHAGRGGEMAGATAQKVAEPQFRSSLPSSSRARASVMERMHSPASMRAIVPSPRS